MDLTAHIKNIEEGLGAMIAQRGQMAEQLTQLDAQIAEGRGALKLARILINEMAAETVGEDEQDELSG